MEQTKNYFETLAEVKCVTEKRKSGNNGPELTYVSWADAWADMKKIHPDAKYTIYENPEGFPFWSSKYGIDVKVGVTVKGLEHIVRLPVMDGNNNAMKDEEYEYEVKGQSGTFTKKVAAADTFDINKAIQRCFAKACAMHGLGLYVYRGEDLPDGVEKVVTNVAPNPATTAPVAAKPATATQWFNHYFKDTKNETPEWKQLRTDMEMGKLPSCEDYIMEIKKTKKIFGPVEDDIRKLFASTSIPF